MSTVVDQLQQSCTMHSSRCPCASKLSNIYIHLCGELQGFFKQCQTWSQLWAGCHSCRHFVAVCFCRMARPAVVLSKVKQMTSFSPFFCSKSKVANMTIDGNFILIGMCYKLQTALYVQPKGSHQPGLAPCQAR